MYFENKIKFSSGNENNSTFCFFVALFSITRSEEINKTVSSMIIYPNPGKGLFTVEMAANPSNTSIEIYNLLGKKVYSQVIHSSKTVLNLKLQSGIYFVNFYDPKGQMRAKRMIIQ